MRTPLNEESFLEFPLHDADYLGVTIIASPNDGRVALYLKVVTNEQEGFGGARKSQHVTLEFEDCRRVIPNILGTNTRREVISTWEIIADSPLIKDLKRHGFDKAIKNQKHFQLQFSGGSRIDVLAKGVILVESDDPAINPN